MMFGTQAFLQVQQVFGQVPKPTLEIWGFAGTDILKV